MSKSKKVSKNKSSIRKEAQKYLSLAFDILEGRYSNIPDCCIMGYLDGRTYMNVRNSLTEKQQKKLEKWEYVPCEECFKKSNVNKLKHNGTSIYGEVIRALIFSLDNEE